MMVQKHLQKYLFQNGLDEENHFNIGSLLHWWKIYLIMQIQKHNDIKEIMAVVLNPKNPYI